MPRRPKSAESGEPTPVPAITEASEQERAQGSPLAMRFECVGCRYATAHPVPGKLIPHFQFHPPCPFKKDQPDQDCRDCVHHHIIPLGQDQWSEHRYHSYGLVIPLTEEQADAVMDTAYEQGSAKLLRPSWQDYYAQVQAEQARVQADQARAAELERRQMGLRANLHPNER